MRKKNLFLRMVFIAVLGIVGCGQKETSETRVEAEKAYEIEADASQTETKEQEEQEKQKAAEQAAIEAQKAAEQAAVEAQVSDETQNLISKEEASEIVLNKVPGAAKTNVRIELEKDDGHWIYEGEIIYDLKEYEFELDAENGTIMEWCVESVHESVHD